MYVEKQEAKNKEIPEDKFLTTSHRALMITTVIVIGLSILIGIGFAYIGYTSGNFSEVYTLCKDDVLSQARVGMYHTGEKIIAALESCNGATS